MVSMVYGELLSQGPYRFQPSNEIPVSDANGALSLAWSGGLNSGQYQTMDLNQDGLMDLVIFDRTTSKISTFINEGNAYSYQPQYEYHFPAGLNGWMILADFNCDGKKDLFTNTTFGLKVYQNIGTETPAFTLLVDPLTTDFNGVNVNLQVSASDIPAIADVDGDGDLDILIFDFAIGGKVEWHQNRSIEDLGNCNELRFELATDSWGNFQECNCGVYEFGGTCSNPGGRQVHAGGKSLLVFDQDHDGDMELVFGDEFCNNIAFLSNEGDAQNALFLSAQTAYPTLANPVEFFIFPALFWEDVNFDGRKDLIAAPNLFENLVRSVDFKASSHLYINNGVDGNEEFSFQQDNWLQDQMIELGESASPVFFDFDGDQDLDMLLGSRGVIQTGGEFYATFQLYENRGTSSNPDYLLTDQDFMGLSSSQLQDLHPSFADLNGDSRPDLIFSAAATSGQTRIYYWLNTQINGFTAETTDPQVLDFVLQNGDTPHFYDLNQDGLADVLLGKRTGRLEYWSQTSQAPLQFDLQNETLAGIGDDTFRRELAPLVSDINGDGSPELLTLDTSGEINVYNNFINPSEAQPLAKYNSVLQPNDGVLNEVTRLGRGSVLTAATLDGQLPYVVVGSQTGGLTLLKNLSDDQGGEPGATLDLRIAPNPTPDVVVITANRNFQWQLFNTLGQLITTSPATNLSNRYTFDSRPLTNGVYLVRVISDNGLEDTKRLLVIR